MNIDRHNYEEYFLLYIDNELTVDQKKRVEVFVRENPDLEEELVMLKQSRLIPDESIIFDKKHLLMKEEIAPDSANNSFINLNNYEQWLIMYVDDELNAGERLAVEKFAHAHPHVQEEVTIFLQAKLQPEEIVFPNKEILYKRETTVRVISMQWWKVAVAAILVISAGITLYSIFNKSTHKGVIPDNVARNEQPVPSISTPSQNKDDQTASVLNEEREQKTATTVDKEQNKEKKQQEKPEEKNKQQLAYTTGQPIEHIDEPKRLQPTTVEINQSTTIEQPKMTDAVAIDDKMHKENINAVAVTNPGVETPDKSSTSDDAVQYASNTENKKFRGFFRKATRLIERTTSINAAEDDKVLIGGMAINLK
jgi:hypothetical protein